MRIPGPAAASLLLLPAVVALTGLPGTPAEAYSLLDVSVSRAPGEATLDVTADGAVRYEIFQLASPDRIVLDLPDAEAAVDPLLGGADPSGWVAGVRGSLWRDDPGSRVVRYVIETTGPARYGVTAEGARLHLCVARAEAGDAAGTPPPILDQAPPIGKADPAFVTAAAMALPEPRPAPAPEPDPPPPPTSPPDGGRPMSLDVQGADVRTVLRSIAEFGHVNIVPDVDVSGPISVRLVDVPWRQALDIVCQSAGLAAVADGDVIRVATKKALMDEELDRESAARKREDFLPLETAIFQVRYANADELKVAVAFALSKRGSAEVDVRTNSVLVTDIAERVDQIRKMIGELDSETLQVEIVAKLVDVDATAARQFGISWSVENLHSTAERLSGSISHDSPIAAATTEVKFGVIRNFANIDGTIQALERTNKANIISNPSITTVNNRRARILVGKQIPLIVLDKAGNPITELKKVGITLEVTPYINSENRVTMDLHPEVSDLSSQATVQGGIVLTTTEADTRVMVADGETAVIGGLIRTNETRFEEGIPVLKSIPIIGNLFKSSDVRKDRRELLIFVTPRIVRGMANLERK